MKFKAFASSSIKLYVKRVESRIGLTRDLELAVYSI